MKTKIIATLLLIGLASFPAWGKTDPVQQFEGGTKYIFDYVPVVALKGSWKDMGRQYGHLLSDNIKEVYDLVAPYKDLYNKACGKQNSEIIEAFYQSYPEKIKEFFHGMSETSGLTLEQLKTANALEIILMFGTGIYNSRCSGLGVWDKYSKDGQVVYGRNYDYNTEFLVLNDDIVVTVFHPDDGSVPAAICAWAGCIYASSGINRSGIFIEENDCSGHDKLAAGIYKTDDHFNIKNWVQDDALLLTLLITAKNLDEADLWMKSNLPIYPHNIGIADKNEARCYQWNIPERIPHAPYVQQAEGLMAQTNHYFVIPSGWDLLPYSEGDPTGSTVPGGSIPRLENLLKLAKQNKGAIDVAGMCRIMDTDF
ncbi:MAG: C45 family peptidase, partial [Candidatus Margulisiibacteriota bacterium]